MSVSRNRDIASILGRSEAINADNTALGGGLTVYATLDDLPTTGLTSGDQAFVSSSSRFYISNGSGWYNVALVNAAPSLSIDPTGTIELNTDGSTTTITLTATDSDNAVAGITFSVESDGNFGGLATLSQDSSVFTITPLSEDSATTTSSTLTFKASDGISFGSGTRDLTLRFSVPNSKYTTMLLKADTGSNDNQVDASTNSLSITEYSTVTSNAFSPYHPAGYSYYFDGSGDYINVTGTNVNSVGSVSGQPFTIEFWYYYSAVGSQGNGLVTKGTSGSTSAGDILTIDLIPGTRYIGCTLDGAYSGYEIQSSTALTERVWYHIALVKNSSNVYTLYINGQADGTYTATGTISASSNFYIGTSFYSPTDANRSSTAYFRDVRVVSAEVYTTTFTPPTSALTAITNTLLLACHLPYIRDGSTSDHTLSTGGTPQAVRYTPYDYENIYSKSSHAGSVHFNGTSDYLDINTSTAADFGTGDFTVEVWWYPTTPTENVVLIAGFTNATNTSNNVCEFYIGLSTGFLRPHVNTNLSGTWTTRIETDKFCFDRTWNHVAYVRNGNVGNIYINGIKGPDTAIDASAQFNNPFSALRLMTSRQTTTNFGKGYLADFRIVKGTAVYTADFTPPTTPLTAISNTEVLTLTNKNDIWDVAAGRVLDKNSTAASTTQRKFATSSALYFDGTTGLEYEPGVDNPIYNFGTDDWTIELWFRPNNGAATYTLLSMIKNNSGSLYNTPHIYMSSSNLYFYTDTNNRIIGGTPASNTWHHLAVTRSGNDHKMFLDGTQIGSTWTNAYTYTQGRVTLGNYYQSLNSLNPSNIFAGYMQDVRITKGLARYTAAFTPPTAEFDG